MAPEGVKSSHARGDDFEDTEDRQRQMHVAVALKQPDMC